MPPVSLAAVYEEAYKASSSFSSTLRNAGNKSLGNLVQQFLPFTESFHSTTQNVITMNNGNLSGEYAMEDANYSAKQTNISISDLAKYTASWGQWDFNGGSLSLVGYSMTYKYVPIGYNYAGSSKIKMKRECVQKLVDVTNYANVNQTSSLPAELSGSFGLPWKSGSNVAADGDDGNPAGTLGCKGLTTSYYYHEPTTLNGISIPEGSGSYKVPQNVSDQSVLFMFWVKVADFPRANTAIWCNSMPQGNGSGTTGNEAWSPYNGYMCEVSSNGSLIFTRGDGTGTSSTDRRTFTTTFQLNENRWNFVAVRLHSNSQSTGLNFNSAYCYKLNGRSYSWSSGLGFTSGTGGAVKYNNRYGMVISPGTNTRYFTGSIGHFYTFWEDNLTKVSVNKYYQTQYNTNSGSYNLYGTF
jgi:hypothetical protein